MKNILNNAVSLIVVMIVLLLIIPLSPFFLDVMIILNIAVSLIILLISVLYQRGAGILYLPVTASDHNLIPYRNQYLLNKEYP